MKLFCVRVRTITSHTYIHIFHRNLHRTVLCWDNDRSCCTSMRAQYVVNHTPTFSSEIEKLEISFKDKYA
jgi:hypothetical protein